MIPMSSINGCKCYKHFFVSSLIYVQRMKVYVRSQQVYNNIDGFDMLLSCGANGAQEMYACINVYKKEDWGERQAR